MKVLLVTPPLTQLNTSYPATCQLLGFLFKNNIEAGQMDLSIKLIEKLFTKNQISDIFQEVSLKKTTSKFSKNILQHADFYINTIEPVIHFLSGNDNTLGQRFSNIDFWEACSHLPSDEDLEWAFGAVGNNDRAKHLCTKFLKDLSKFIQENIDTHFELIRYAESLCLHLPEFDPLQKELENDYTLIDKLMLSILEAKITETNPEYIGFTVPFPGNLYSALRCSQWIKRNYPDKKIIMGGGYVNTELRSLSDGRIFDYIDYLIFDDGELPLLNLLSGKELIRTLYRGSDGEIVRENFESKANIAFSEIGTPSYKGMLNNKYIHIIELTNPMHSLWSNGRWNKMMLAHGCYWAKCSFCDGSLDYIKRFDNTTAEILVDRMESIIDETGCTGFHFVDEAAPPALLRKLSEEIIKRKLTVSYWTNVRFEKSYTPELCYLMSKSGCIAISGGLEVASPRILKLINKGITIETATESMKNFSENNIMTHAYLMYGFPTETAQETLESLDVVRSLFQEGFIQSAFWHRYAMTIHSPSGQTPESVGAKHIKTALGRFSNNEIPFSTNNEIDLDYYGKGLNNATYNYMHGLGFDVEIKNWFKITKK